MQVIKVNERDREFEVDRDFSGENVSSNPATSSTLGREMVRAGYCLPVSQ